MRHPPRPVGEGVLTPQMWRGIALVGLIMAAGTLFALDSSMPDGLVDGSGGVRYAQTMAFTTLMLFQAFNVLNARSDDVSAFVGLFANHWLWAAMALSVSLQVIVVHVPALQQAFGTVGLSAADWIRCTAIASSVLWLREIDKVFTRLRRGARRSGPIAGRATARSEECREGCL
jgi:P-type Ca2+ transporter type 2C